MSKRLNILIGLLLILVIVVIAGRGNIQKRKLESRLNALQGSSDPELGRVWSDLIRLDPSNEEYLLERARWRHTSGRDDLALREVETFLEQFPDSAAGSHLKGQIALQLGDAETALEALRRAMELNADAPEYRVEAAKVCNALGFHEDAVALVDEALELGDSSDTALVVRAQANMELGETELALADYTTLVSNRGAGPEILILRGRCYAALNDEASAEADLQRAVVESKDDPEAAFALAALYRDFDRFDESLATIDTILESNPNSTRAYAERAATYRAAGRLNASLIDLETAIGINANDVSLFTMAAAAYADLVDFRSAASAANSALYLLDESDPELLVGILVEKSRYERERRQPGRAIQDCEQALNLLPDSVEARVALGRAYLLRGNLDYAINEFEKALGLDENRADTLAALAEYHILDKEYDVATEYVNSVLENSPDNGQALMLSARIATETGQYRKALDDSRSAIRNGMALNADAHELQRRIMESLNDSEGAEQAARMANAITKWERDAMDPRPMMTLAEELIAMDAPHEALKVYACQLYRTPGEIDLYLKRGELCLELGYAAWAEDDFGEVLKRNPNSKAALEKRAQAYAALGDTARQRADEEAAARIEGAGDDATGKGELDVDAPIKNFQQLADSLGSLAKRIEKDPGNRIWLSQRADLYGKMQNHKAALDDYTKLIALDSSNPNYYVRRALHYERLGAYENALSDYLIALERAPEHPEAREKRQDLLNSLGRTEQAEREAAEWANRSSVNARPAAGKDLSNTDVPREKVDIPRDPLRPEVPEEGTEEPTEAPTDETPEEPTEDGESDAESETDETQEEESPAQ